MYTPVGGLHLCKDAIILVIMFQSLIQDMLAQGVTLHRVFMDMSHWTPYFGTDTIAEKTTYDVIIIVGYQIMRKEAGRVDTRTLGVVQNILMENLYPAWIQNRLIKKERFEID